jgi:hypothetical protein
MSEGTGFDGTGFDGTGFDGTGGIGGRSGVPGAAGGADGPYRGWVLALVCGVLPAALLAAIVAVPAALWSQLPARVADHWTLTGTADGTAPRLLPIVLSGVVALLGSALVWLAWARARSGGSPSGRLAGPRANRAVAGRPGRALGLAGLIATGLFVTAISTASVIMVAVANLGGESPQSTSVGVGGLLGLVGGPALLTAGAGYGLRRYGGLGAADDGAPRSTIGLRAGERAVWTGRAHARWAPPGGLLLVAAGALVAVLTTQRPLTVVLLVVGVFLLGFSSVRVTVAARGVTVGYGLLGLRLTRIPLRRIALAEAVDRPAFGFGYRGSLLVLGAAAVVLRPGPALRLTLRDGKTFLVTVDDAATGAALLNDLIAGAPRQHGEASGP